eukprot:365668-Chlamydomonas_euryale.AAC.2
MELRMHVERCLDWRHAKAPRIRSGSCFRNPACADVFLRCVVCCLMLLRMAARCCVAWLQDERARGLPVCECARQTSVMQAACTAIVPGWLCSTAAVSGITMEVQTQLGDAEKEDKSDDSPVTVADYGAGHALYNASCDFGCAGPFVILMLPMHPVRSMYLVTWRYPDCILWLATHCGVLEAHSAPPLPKCLVAFKPAAPPFVPTPTGAQVLVAWVLQKSCAPARLSMVAEEDSTTLTCVLRDFDVNRDGMDAQSLAGWLCGGWQARVAGQGGGPGWRARLPAGGSSGPSSINTICQYTAAATSSLPYQRWYDKLLVAAAVRWGAWGEHPKPAPNGQAAVQQGTGRRCGEHMAGWT